MADIEHEIPVQTELPDGKFRYRRYFGGPAARRIAIAALLFAASAAAAQQNNKVPSNTVIGRLGKGTSGPSQAIPFATLFAQVTGITGPVISGNNVCFSNANGQLQDCGSSPTATPFTAPGTGGRTTTVQTVLRRVLWVADYATVQEAIDEAQSLNLPLRCNDTYPVPVGGLSITNSIDLGGTSPTACVFNTPAGTNAITVTTSNAVYLHDFKINYVGAKPGAGDIALLVTAAASAENGSSLFSNLVISGPNYGIYFARASDWVLANSTIENITASGYGIVVANANNADSGDSTAYGNTISTTTTGAAAVLWQSSGGFRFVNNKINGGSWTYGFQVALESGASTSDIFIQDNSIEGLASTGHGISFYRAGATGTLISVLVSNNEIFGGQGCVNEPLDSNGSWLIGVNVGSNACEPTTSSGTIAYDFATSVSGLNVGGGTVYAPLGTNNQAINIGGTQTTADCQITPIATVGTFIANVTGGCAPGLHNGGPGAALPILAWSATAPAIASGFCTSPSISNNNGTAAFTITIGSSCAGSVGVLAMPAAAHGWTCDFHNLTNPAANKPDEIANSATTVSVTNYSRTTGSASNFTAGDVIAAQCTGY